MRNVKPASYLCIIATIAAICLLHSPGSLAEDNTAVPAANKNAANIRDKSQEPICQKTSEIDNIKAHLSGDGARIASIDSDLQKLNERFSTYFVTQFSALTQMGVGVIVPSISVLVALAALLINYFLNIAVKSAHDRELQKTKIILDEKVKIATSEASAKIYTMFGGHCINLYKDFKDPSDKNKNICSSYVNIAIAMSKYGHLNSEVLEKTLESQGIKPDDGQKWVISACINNYAFYLAQRGLPQDKTELGKLLPKLQKLILEEGNDPGWWDHHETLAWVNLNLGIASAVDTNREVNAILKNPVIPESWKEATVGRYDFYDRFVEHVDKVEISELK